MDIGPPFTCTATAYSPQPSYPPAPTTGYYHIVLPWLQPSCLPVWMRTGYSLLPTCVDVHWLQPSCLPVWMRTGYNHPAYLCGCALAATFFRRVCVDGVGARQYLAWEGQAGPHSDNNMKGSELCTCIAWGQLADMGSAPRTCLQVGGCAC